MRSAPTRTRVLSAMSGHSMETPAPTMVAMEDPGSSRTPEGPFGDAFSDVPLFREIQRVLLAGSGPINWELARQVGIAMASWGKEDPAPTDEDRRGFEDTVRA